MVEIFVHTIIVHGIPITFSSTVRFLSLTEFNEVYQYFLNEYDI